jgi:DNA invertase Pin-like site-specific DNA recombinase
MMDGKFVAYLRVSTDRQGASGPGLEAQREAVRNYLNGGNWRLLHAYVEVESGKHDDRPELARALAQCKRTCAVLIVAKLDRLSRNVAFLANLMESGVEFVACDFPHANRLTLHILAAVAEHEREMISARTKAALQAAKARGQRLGGYREGAPKVDQKLGAQAVQKAAEDYAREVAPTMRELRQGGLSLREVAAEMDARGIRTPRGGQWTAMGVRNVLERAARIGA